jgi:hypothetical protein
VRAVKDIPLQPVQSSNIAAVGHDPATQTLAVQFKGSEPARIYHYHGVTTPDHLAMMAADSVGSHFARHIKGRFPSKQVS